MLGQDQVSHLSGCAMCEAVVADTFNMILFSAERPAKASDEVYESLRQKVEAICHDLSMRRPIVQVSRNAIKEECEDFMDSHEAAILRLLINRDVLYAQRLCKKQLRLCKDEIPRIQFYEYSPASHNFPIRTWEDDKPPSPPIPSPPSEDVNLHNILVQLKRNRQGDYHLREDPAEQSPSVTSDLQVADTRAGKEELRA